VIPSTSRNLVPFRMKRSLGRCLRESFRVTLSSSLCFTWHCSWRFEERGIKGFSSHPRRLIAIRIRFRVVRELVSTAGTCAEPSTEWKELEGAGGTSKVYIRMPDFARVRPRERRRRRAPARLNATRYRAPLAMLIIPANYVSCERERESRPIRR